MPKGRCNVWLWYLICCCHVIAGLLLISRHAAQFQEYLARDYNVSRYCVFLSCVIVSMVMLQLQAMYSIIFTWCNHHNRDVKKLAFPALEAFLQQVGSCDVMWLFQLMYLSKVSMYILREDDGSKKSDNGEMFRVLVYYEYILSLFFLSVLH